MSRTWAMGVSFGDQVKKHEAMREGMIAASGISKEHLEGARRVLSTQHTDREPTLANGMEGSPAIVKGERFDLIESHVNGHGEIVLVGYKKNGPQFEKIRIRQEQAAAHTRVVTEIKGDR